MNLFFSRPIYLLVLLALIPLVYFWMKTPTSLTPRRKRDSLLLRVLSVLCLILALAGAQVVGKSDKLTVLFLLDRSLSTGGNSEGWQRDYISAALENKNIEDQHGVVLFGEDSGIELPAGTHSRTELGKLTTIVDPKSSQLTSALRFAATAFPGGTARRLVVLTDGRTTESDAGPEVQALSDAGIEVWMVPLPERKVKDVLLSRLESPAQIAVNEPFLLRAVIESQGLENCKLLITENGKPKQTLNLKLREGPNLFLLPQKKTTSGPVLYEARLISEEDSRPQNNKGETLSLIGGEQTVIVLRNDPGPGPLVTMMREAGIKARSYRPNELPKAVGAWRDVSCLVIEDVDSLSWSKRLQNITSLLVREGGMGLLMCGSDSTFGVGAYQRTPIEPLLPVNLSIRRPKDQPLSALVQLIDKSGSMTGEPIRMAREAAIAAMEPLSERDLIGVIGFDSAAYWIAKLKPKGDGTHLKNAIRGLRAGGGTDLYPAFKEALDDLSGTKAPLKHIIVLSDGAVGAANYNALLKRANEERVTVSTVAFGQGADVRFLEDLAKRGKGRFFRSAQTAEGSTLAQIFIRDTVLATGSGIQDKPMNARPTSAGQFSPILADLNLQNSPPLAAHNMASSKGGTAKTLLQTKKEDPILATGRAGLGITAAWLTDLGGDWSKSWTTTPGSDGQSLLETVLLRTLRSIISSDSRPLASRGNQLDVRPAGNGDMATLEVRLKTRKPLTGPVKVVSVAKDGSNNEVILHPYSPFEARGLVRVTEPGSGLVLAQDTSGRLLGRTNFTISLAPEFTKLGTDEEALKRWSQVPNGRFSPEVDEVFQKPSSSVPIRTPLDHDLARGALLLLLLEIAVRRLPVPKPGSRSKATPKKERSASLNEKFAKLRAAKKATKESSTTSPAGERKPKLERRSRMKKSSTPPPSKPQKSTSKPPQPAAEKSEESTLARLKRARKKKK